MSRKYNFANHYFVLIWLLIKTITLIILKFCFHDHMYVCIHVFIYDVFMCICACLYMYIWMNGCILCVHDVCMHACVHGCTYVCIHVCMIECMYVCMHACMLTSLIRLSWKMKILICNSRKKLMFSCIFYRHTIFGLRSQCSKANSPHLKVLFNRTCYCIVLSIWYLLSTKGIDNIFIKQWLDRIIYLEKW